MSKGSSPVRAAQAAELEWSGAASASSYFQHKKQTTQRNQASSRVYLGVEWTGEERISGGRRGACFQEAKGEPHHIKKVKQKVIGVRWLGRAGQIMNAAGSRRAGLDMRLR